MIDSKLTRDEMQMIEDKMNNTPPENNVQQATNEELEKLWQDCLDTRNFLQANKVPQDNFAWIVLNSLEAEVQKEKETRGIK